MLTLSSLNYLFRSMLYIFIFSGCLDTATPPLPDSSLEVESWLQTSRKVRYSLDVNTQWEGWILHSPNPTQIGIARFKLDTLPNAEQWQKCIRAQTPSSTLWLSSTPNMLEITKQYATDIHDTLPIIQVDC